MAKLKSAIPPIDETEKHNAWALYMAKFPSAVIAERVGVSINTLNSWIVSDGWFKKREAFLKAWREKHPAEESGLAKAFSPEKKAENVKIFLEKTGQMAVDDATHWADAMEPEDRLAAGSNIAALNKAHRSNLDLDKEEVGDRGHISLTFLGNPDAVRILESPAPKQLENAE